MLEITNLVGGIIIGLGLAWTLELFVMNFVDRLKVERDMRIALEHELRKCEGKIGHEVKEYQQRMQKRFEDQDTLWTNKMVSIDLINVVLCMN